MGAQIEIEEPRDDRGPITLLAFDLRDKPPGYFVGLYRGNAAFVEACPKCDHGGIRTLKRLLTHVVVIKEHLGELFLDRTEESCSVPERERPCEPDQLELL